MANASIFNCESNSLSTFEADAILAPFLRYAGRRGDVPGTA